MKVIVQNLFVLLVVLLLIMVLPVFGQGGGDYELSWSTIDGGGGRSSGGVYELMGTIGQPDAAAMSGGDYELLGGFWPGGPLCIVDFERYARFADNWLQEGCNETNDWCDGADLYVDENNIVNGLDLKAFVEAWLCYCPVEWSLK